MIRYDDICAALVTRGDVDMSFAESLPYGEVLIADNSAGTDLQVSGRYHVAEQSARPFVYFQDDDVRFTDHDELLRVANLHPDKLVSNMYDEWIEGCGYFDLALVGLGSICPNGHWQDAFRRYLDAYPNDERFPLDCDFVFGVLSRWHRGDFGHDILDIASDPSRLWKQEGQFEAKWKTIRQARELRQVVLTMLVKDEEENILRALGSAEGIYDKVLLIDTGSTDKTLELAGHWLAERKVQHLFVKRPWVDFGHNRTELLEEGAKMGDYMLLMDADEELTSQRLSLPGDSLLGDGYFLHYDGEIDYAQPRIIYRNFPWRWDGRVHAALDTHLNPLMFDLREPRIIHHGDNRHGETKLRRDIELLTEAIEGVALPLEGEAVNDLARNLFLRGKAYEGLGMWDEAMYDYMARVGMSQGDEEAYYAQFRLGVILIEQRGSFAEGADALMSAYLSRPSRVEAARALAHYLTALCDQTPYPVDDKVIVHRNLYTHQD